MPALSQYFQSPHFEEALERYARFASGRGWGIGHKLKMYNWAKTAFDPDLAEDIRRWAFGNIYRSLKGGWRVFRNSPAGYWSADETFAALTGECQAFSQQSGLNLMTLRPHTAESAAVLAGLGKLRNLKCTRYYPSMPVAKFTHFFNPMLFPIYDTDVIWNRVLNGVFKQDYRRWCTSIEVEPWRIYTESARFNLTYTLMAGDLLRSADEEFMKYFSQWFRAQVAGSDDENTVLLEIDRYYATAFEFVAVGAACL